MSKEEQYRKIVNEILDNIGGADNIQGLAHCATRLRIVCKDNDKINQENLENVDLVKGVFIAGDQLQIIFGAGLVNEVYAVFAKMIGQTEMNLGEDNKTEKAESGAGKPKNLFQTFIKSISDVFVEIIPAILAAALLMGITGMISNSGTLDEGSTLYALNKFANIASSAIFNVLPMVVCYSATKRYGGNPILGLVVGAIMIDPSLANAYDVGSGKVVPDSVNLFGLNIALVGFQGGIIVALMMGYLTAKLNQFFDKYIPSVVKLIFVPVLTVSIATLLLFIIIGPVGRGLADGITTGLVWMVQNLGVFGYMFFAGIQQIVVITGLHHVFNAVEAQLIASTQHDFLNPLMSVALMGQGGAVLGYLALHWKNNKAKELCIPSFLSTLFGISEPAIFGVNLRHKFPLIAGCLAGAVGGAVIYYTHVTAIGFGATAIPGLAIIAPENNGYINYIFANMVALVCGIVFTIIISRFYKKK